MSLYKVTDSNSLERIKEKKFKLEKNMQHLVENNLEELFNLELICSEFSVDNYRLDTVAYNRESNSFVIIEYKKSKSFSVIDQGYAYLNTLLARKEAFVLAFNERYPKDIRNMKSFDWSQTKIMFVAQEFTEYQYGAVANPQLPIELVTIKYYENQIIEIMMKMKYKRISSQFDKRDAIPKGLSEELIVYQEEDLLDGSSEFVKELYEALKEVILSWDPEIEVKPTKLYNAFKKKRNIVDIRPQKNQLKLWINLREDELVDAKGLARNVKNTGHWGNGDYEIIMKNDDDLEYVLSLIKQSWKNQTLL